MPHDDSIIDFLGRGNEMPDQGQTLSGGYVGQSSFAKDDVLRKIDSILKALAGPHTQIAENMRNGEMPTEPSNILEAIGLLPMGGMARGPSRAVSSELGGRQLRMINEVENWLNQSGIEYSLNMNRSNANSVYIYARHPTTNENVAIRVPRDGHIGFVDQRAQAKYKDTNRPGNFFDTGHTITSTNRPPQAEYVGNVRGEPYYDLDTLFDALRHRFSRSPEGQFLISPGREPHYPSERFTPIPMTNSPVAWGRRGIRQDVPPELLNGPNRRPGGRIVIPPRQPRQLDLFR